MKSKVCPLMIGGMPMLLLTAACGVPLPKADLLGRAESMWDVSGGDPHQLHGQLNTLETLGYLRRAGTVPSAGRPSVLWVITREGEEVLDKCWPELMAWKRERQDAA
ncbi:hypothetical protein [Deinococcus radiotolerans]|uniref:Uncharacterized protein n=1 Tax=Deinococcus radiotolerans TaxID=1309407 RepID=A0ABQ2FPZ3_9DEIO|nr:hypothetical protein [Deinococcus radiotolerans]GGL15491.1 hypothetical protein GCM10010844_37930 [Deinococcus radiotolerans]